MSVSQVMRPLGRAGPPVTRIGLGLAALGRPGYLTVGHGRDLGADKSIDGLRRRAWATLDEAWSLGIRYIDVARSYGRAEDFVATWLAERSVSPDDVTVGSKWGYRYTAEWRVDASVHEVKDHSMQALRDQLRTSQQQLGAYLRVYQIHSATEESGVLGNGDVLDELARLRDAGITVGLSLSGARQWVTLERALSIRRGDALLFGSVQATWNVLEPSVGTALAAAHRAGMGVIVKEALANGRLVAGDASTPDDLYVDARDTLAREAARLGVGSDALALAVVLAQPWVDVVLSGAVDRRQLASNVAALDIAIPLDVMDRLTALSVPADAYWQARSAASWT